MNESDVMGPSTSGAVRPKKRQENLIWEYFKKTTKEECKCNICFQTIKSQYGSTTSLRRHLQRKHCFKFKQFLKEEEAIKEENAGKTRSTQIASTSSPKQLGITQFVSMKEKYGQNHPKEVAIKNAVTKWMVESLHPFTLVEEPGLLKVLEIADSKISLPSAKTFSRTLVPELFKKAVAKMKCKLENEKPTLQALSITTDMWTSVNTTSYLAVTVHYVTKDFALTSHCLGCTVVTESHTGQVIRQELHNILNEWGLLDTKELYCVTDNAANMRSALNLMPEITQLFCFAHTLNLMIKDTKKEYSGFDKMRHKCKSIVEHFRHSAIARANLHSRLKQLGMRELELIQNIETRWNSEYLMMERLCDLKDALVIELSQPGCRIDNLTSTEWSLVDSYVKVLKPIYDATLQVSSEKKPTRSMIIPILFGIESNINSVIENKQQGSTLAKTLLKSLKSRFPMYLEDQLNVICMVFDPRFKFHILQEHQQKILLEKLETEIFSSIKEVPVVRLEESTSKSITTSATSQLFSIFENPSCQRIQTNKRTLALQGKLQLEAYINEPRIKINDDPFQWWRDNSFKYEFISPLAQKYLGIPATEVASERVFSSAGNVITNRRTRLSPENAEKLVFLHQNLKSLDL